MNRRKGTVKKLKANQEKLLFTKIKKQTNPDSASQRLKSSES